MTLSIIFIVVGCFLMQVAFVKLLYVIFAAYNEHMKLQEDPEYCWGLTISTVCGQLIVWGSSVGLTLVIVGAALL